MIGFFSLRPRVQTGSGARPASYRGLLLQGYRGRDVKLLTHSLLVQRSRIRDTVPPNLHTSSRRGA